MGIDVDRIREVLRKATGDSGGFTQRGLSKLAKEGRDCVGDIINGRNKNPTIKVLSNLAEAMGRDISVFGIQMRADAPSERELHDALIDVLPGLPRGSVQRRAEYLAEAVAGVLGLPPDRLPNHLDGESLTTDGREANPLPDAPTK